MYDKTYSQTCRQLKLKAMQLRNGVATPTDQAVCKTTNDENHGRRTSQNNVDMFSSLQVIRETCGEEFSGDKENDDKKR
ncbi:unnamed protein product [Phytophthora lilii]|uniref:Unnamed protein product n=1 Tax=Phytophthora lilii TaxID=2077276 RepID=A0A9W6X561_9STRA|nr:unnamed protein product [Phytophthora lilii]